MSISLLREIKIPLVEYIFVVASVTARLQNLVSILLEKTTETYS